MQRPWMPLHVADYIADTIHLSTREHGAYLLLIMAYWKDASLPQEDARLARITRLTLPEWLEIRDAIADMFGPAWTHKRIDAEIAKANDISEKRRFAHSQRGKGAARDKTPTPEGTLVGSGAAHEPTHAEHVPTHAAHLRTQDITGQNRTGQNRTERKEEEVVAEPLYDDAVIAAAVGGSATTAPLVDEDARPVATTRARRDRSEYAIWQGDFRILNEDLETFQKAYGHIDVMAELMSASGWAIDTWGKGRWFSALKAWLTKRNNEARDQNLNRRARVETEVEIAGKPKASRFAIPRTPPAATALPH